MKTRQIVWSSSSYNEGDDGVFFFDLGKVNTAHGMASGMVRSVVRKDGRGHGGKERATLRRQSVRASAVTIRLTGESSTVYSLHSWE